MARLPIVSLLSLALCGVVATAHAEPTSQPAGPAPSAVPTARFAPAPAPPPGSAPYPQGANPRGYAPSPPSAHLRGTYPGSNAPSPQNAPYLAPRRDAATSNKRAGDNYMARPLAIFGQLSFGGPYGLFGASLNYSVSRYAALEAGGGLGSGGPELGAMVLPRIPLTPGFAIGAGLGMSGVFGYQEPFACFMAFGSCTPPKWSFAPFAQGELYLEERTDRGFSVRGYFGVWRLLDTTPDVCPDTCTPTETVSAPYFGVALGGAL